MRASQFIAYLNMEKAPTLEESQFLFTHLTITPKLKAIRRKYRAEQRKRRKKEASDAPI